MNFGELRIEKYNSGRAASQKKAVGKPIEGNQMSISNIKARLVKLCEMGWKDLTELKAWLKQTRTFDRECFSNPSLRVASATNNGQAVAFCLVESAFVINGFAINPNATPEDAKRAGDFIEGTLEHEAQKAGMSKLLLVVPKDHPAPDGEWKELRVFSKRIDPSVVMGGVTCSAQSQATRYLN